MRPPDEKRVAWEAEIVEAERAMAQGHHAAARQHLHNAAEMGGPHAQIGKHLAAIDEASKSQAKRTRKSRWAGFWLGVLGYLVLSLKQPPEWTMVVWTVAAFLVIPLLAGYATGRLQGAEQPSAQRFRAAFVPVAWAMILYAGITLFVLRMLIKTGGPSGQIFMVGLFVTAVYAVLAGVVAGFASALLAWRTVRRVQP